jgi:hypothetical protein
MGLNFMGYVFQVYFKEGMDMDKELYRMVCKLEAICEEQDEQLAAIVEYQNKQDKLLQQLQDEVCTLKESDGRNSGVVYGHYFDPALDGCTPDEEICPEVAPLVNVDQVYTEQHEEPDVTMKDAAPVYLNPKYDGPVGP